MLTRSFWDSQFKFSEVLPGFHSELERMSEASAKFASGRDFERRSYGDSDRQWVEWTKGDGEDHLLPVIIHGGYWRALDAASHRFMMQGYVGQHAHVANVEYRLMPSVRLNSAVGDVTDAIKALMAAFPASDILLIGHSAGAHLALCALEDEAVRKSVKGVIALSGVFDLAPVSLSFLQDELALTETEISSFTLRPCNRKTPVLYVNGSKETHEFLRGSSIMASAPDTAWQVLDGADHMTLTRQATDRAGELLTRLYLIGDSK